MPNWEKTKYGYELTSDKYEKEYALLKQNPDTGQYYISCMNNCSVRIWLDVDNIDDAKRATMEEVIKDLQYEAKNVHEQIQAIEYLMIYGNPIPEEE
jgi:hypothetical protein